MIIPTVNYRYQGDNKRYNLQLVDSYRPDLQSDLLDTELLKQNFSNTVIRVPMPNRSLIVLYGPVRYQWEHCVLREDIVDRRVCVAYREFTPPYLSRHDGDNGRQSDSSVEIGRAVLEQSKVFWNHLDQKAAV